MPRPLLLPCETRSRELDARLLLACVAAERGFACVVGSRTEMHWAAARLPRGIYLAKDARRSSLRMLRILRQLGHEVAAWDEEALVRDGGGDPERDRQRLDAESLARVSELLAWGDEQAQQLAGCEAARGIPVRVTGNPRVDLLRPELRGFHAREVAAIQERFGSPLLLNSSFGRVNHFLPGQGDPADEPSSAHRRALLEHFLALVPVLARAFPERALVVRPHPAESHEAWRRAARGQRNVHVIHEGSVVPWLLASQALVHNGCTTALEGWLLGVPALSFRPLTSARFDRPLPDALSEPARDPAGLVAALRGLLERRRTGAPAVAPAEAARRDALVRRHVAALDGPLASERIADALLRLDAGAPTSRPPAATRLRARLHAAARTALARGVKARIPGHKNSAVYQRHRFPDLCLDEVAERLERLAKATGRFESLRARGLGRNLFLIT